jgi:hypothetical protein
MINLEQDVANCPREYLTLYILSIMASNLFQWKISFKEILGKIGSNILSWIRDIEDRILNANADSKIINDLLAKQRLFFLYATVFFFSA